MKTSTLNGHKIYYDIDKNQWMYEEAIFNNIQNLRLGGTEFIRVIEELDEPWEIACDGLMLAYTLDRIKKMRT